MLVRVHARRFSTAAAAANTVAASNGPLARLTSLFKPQEIEDIVEMKTLLSVQRLAEQLAADTSSGKLPSSGSDSIRDWLQSYQQEKQLSTLDKAAFQQLMQDAAAHISASEATILADLPLIDGSTVDDEHRSLQDAYIQALHLKLLGHKYRQIADHFEHADEDKDGSISVGEVERLVKVINGTGDDWIRYHFELCDTDSDELVTELESKQILDAIILLQKQVLAELFATRVANLPKKKPGKVIQSALEETNWKEKLPEKVRCVFHFAVKEDSDKKLVHWEAFKESQEIEIPELNELLRVYAKGVYDERYTFYERKQEARSRRLKGVALAIALGVGDFIFALI